MTRDCSLVASVAASTTQRSAGRQYEQTSPVCDDIRPRSSLVVDDVALCTSARTVEPRDVDPGEIEPPGHYPVGQRSGVMAHRCPVTERVLHGAGAHEVPTDLVQGSPKVSKGIEAVSNAHELPRCDAVNELFVAAAGVEGLGTAERTADRGEVSDQVHRASLDDNGPGKGDTQRGDNTYDRMDNTPPDALCRG